MKDLYIRPDTIKLLEENIGRMLFNVDHSKFFFQSNENYSKTKINKLDLMKLKSFCTAMKNINKTKRQPSKWDKIFQTKQLTED